MESTTMGKARKMRKMRSKEQQLRAYVWNENLSERGDQQHGAKSGLLQTKIRRMDADWRNQKENSLAGRHRCVSYT